MELVNKPKRYSAFFTKTTAVCGGIVTALGLMALMGWISGLRVLASINPNYIPMAPDTAVLFVLFGLILLGHALELLPHRLRALGILIGALGSVYGLLKFIEYFVKLDLTFESVLFPITERLGSFPIGRISPLTGMLFLLSGVALLLALGKPRTLFTQNLIGILGMGVLGVGFVATLGYGFGTPLLYGGDLTPLAAMTALAFILYGLGLIATLGSLSWIVRPFVGISVQAMMLRILLPFTAAVVLIQGLAHEIITNLSDINHALLTAVFTMVFVAAVAAIVTYIARTVSRRIDHAEVALRESEEVFRIIFERAMIGKSLTAPDGTLLKINQAFADLLGYTINEMQQFSFAQITHPEDLAESQECSRSLLANERNSCRMEKRYIHKSGKTIWADVSTTLVRDGSGSPLYFLTSIMDITERVRAEDELRKLSRAVEQSSASVVITDPVGNIEYVNPKFTQLTGYTLAEALGQNPRILKSGHTPHEEYQQLWKTILSGNEWRGEFWNKKKNGDFYWETATISPIFNERGKITHFLAVKEDITERKRTEHELKQTHEELKSRVGELEQRTLEFALLDKMGDLLEACLTIPEAYGVIAQFASQLFPDDCGALYLISNSRNLVESVTTWGDLPLGQVDAVFAPNDCWALRRGRMHIVQGAHAGLACPHVKPQHTPNGLRAYLCIPMTAQAELLGLFYLQSHAKEISQGKERLAAMVTEHLALAMASLRLREALREQALRDPLTGLYNRRYLTDTLERELHRAARRQTQVGVLMLDLDHFKTVNDTFAHDVGDAFLRSVGQLLMTYVRKEDFVCRYGGEEFIIILPETTLAEAKLRADELRSEIQHMNVKYQGHSYGNLTASFGVALFPEHGTSVETILHAADAALYQAKTNGRNRVFVAPSKESPETGSIA